MILSGRNPDPLGGGGKDSGRGLYNLAKVLYTGFKKNIYQSKIN